MNQNESGASGLPAEPRRDKTTTSNSIPDPAAAIHPLDEAPYFAATCIPEAQEWADRISGDSDYGHRGAIAGDDYDIILYGQDGYQQDPRTRREVEIIMEALAGSGLELQLGLDTEDGYTWAILVRPGYPHDLHDLSEEAWDARHEAMRDLVWWAWAVARGLHDLELEYGRKLAVLAAERLIGGGP